MPTTSIVKYIYNNATEEVVRRGKKIYNLQRVSFIKQDETSHAIIFKVSDDIYNTQYTVHVYKFYDPKSLNLRCTCTYNVGKICRHKAAALFYLQNMLNLNILQHTQQTYHQNLTNVNLTPFNTKTIQLQCSNQTYNQAQQFLRLHKANIITAEKEKIKAVITVNQNQFEVNIQRTENNLFTTSCSCNSEHHHPLCIHKTILLLQLLHTHGSTYFNSINDWKEQKNQLLSSYGYSLDDDLSGKFEFLYNNGKPFLRVLDPTLKKKTNTISSITQTTNNNFDIGEQKQILNINYKLGVVINLNDVVYPYFKIDAVQGELDETNTYFINKVKRIDFGKPVNTNVFEEYDKILLQQLRKLQSTEIHKFIDRKSTFTGFWQNVKSSSNKGLQETEIIVLEYLHPKIKQLFNELNTNPLVFYLPQHKSFVTENLKQTQLSNNFIHPIFKIQPQQQGFHISINVNIQNSEIPFIKNEIQSTLLFKYNNIFYTWANTKDIETINQLLPDGELIVNINDWPTFLQEKLLPLTQEYNIDLGTLTQEYITNIEPKPYIQLHENADYIIFQPEFTYNNYKAETNSTKNIFTFQNNIIQIIERNITAEKSFVNYIQSLHQEFIRTENSYSLLLKGKELLKNNWLFTFTQTMQEAKISVLGWDALKKFRFNSNKASTQLRITSNIDWFDVDIQVNFGNQQANISQIQKALAKQQAYVQLPDGSLGILNEEWIKKYALLFKVGENQHQKLKVTNHHFNIIDELFEAKNDVEETHLLLHKKIEQLKHKTTIQPILPPTSIQNILRPYQVQGFQWLCYLYNIGWGGILADDMGLGKTLQTLSFLLYLKETTETLKVLIVSPTTLLYTWENEIKKFTPQLSYHIHHGNYRSTTTDTFNNINIILTTYGTLRSDIPFLTPLQFDYVVLDESQFIKNPTSKAAKAAMLLKTTNRICLSGTPLQNNTFDIYAQMQFLNPGILGGIEHFKQNFAIPIDKSNDITTKEQLRKLLQPFMLRRTKEQVAKDLPAKTETILYCEMGVEQRQVYETYRQLYKNKILESVQEQGIQKSQFTILQGLMKLRQICNSPAILNEERTSNNHSVKLDELTRELHENIGNHKALVFSQFLGMLDLIKEQLIKMKIPFVYFDGSTSAVDREKAIQQFQQNDNCRVFLISLKAGGVGLNLTAADYVYLVDPWWNPAVEQQAIDRTHRIGQNKNVFAYRMICKNTIEDKILTLQEQKKLLAKDLISETGFVSTLSQEDIEYLFED